MSKRISMTSMKLDEIEKQRCLLKKKCSVDVKFHPTEPSPNETCKQRMERSFHSQSFHLAIVILCCLDGLLVICMLLLEIEVLKLSPSKLRSNLVLTQFIFECCSLSIVSLFLIEVPFKVWLFGIKFFCKHWLELIDATICVVSFAVDVYNIVRHTQHASHSGVHLPSNPQGSDHHTRSITTTATVVENMLSAKATQNTLADAASLLVLFRLWRVIRIVNAIVMSVITSQENSMKSIRELVDSSEDRIAQLESLLQVHQIPIPDPPFSGKKGSS